jgi:hypothetical protein
MKHGLEEYQDRGIMAIQPTKAYKITTDEVIAWGAERLLNNQQLTDTRKNEIRKVTQYNLLVNAFNASTVLLVVSVAMACFFAYAAALTLGAIGLFVRFAALKEHNKYTLPYQPPPEQAGAQQVAQAMWGRLRDAFQTAMLKHALHQETLEEKTENLFNHLGINRQEGYEPYTVLFDDMPLWMATVKEPPSAVELERQDPPVPAAQASAAASGIWTGMVRKVVAGTG